MEIELLEFIKEDFPKAKKAFEREKEERWRYRSLESKAELVKKCFKPLVEKYGEALIQKFLCGKWYRGSGKDSFNYRTTYKKYTLALDEDRKPGVRLETVCCTSFSGDNEQKVYDVDSSSISSTAQLQDTFLDWEDFFLDFILSREENHDEWQVGFRSENCHTWAAEKLDTLFEYKAQ